MIKRILMLGIEQRGLTIAALALLTLFFALGLPNLKVDTGFESLISDTDPDRPAYDRISQEFGSDDKTIIFIQDSKLWSPQKLSALERLHHEFLKLEFITRVDDVFSAQMIRGKEGKLMSRPLLAEAPKDEETALQAKKDALYHPLVVNGLVSGDGSATALILSTQNGDSEKKVSDEQVNKSLDDVIQPFSSRFEEIFQLGAPRINAELKRTLFDDLIWLGPLSAIVLVIAILLFLKSWIAAVLPLATSLLSLVWTFGFMAWCGIPINILSAMLPSLIIVIGATEDTHMMSAYQDIMAGDRELNRDQAVRSMLRKMGVPLFLTILTTALGFASNILADVGLIRDFAIASTFAIIANGVITVLFIPLALSVINSAQPALSEDRGVFSRMPGWFVRAFSFINKRYPYLTLLLTAVLCLIFVIQAAKLNVTNDPMSYFKQDQDIIQDAEKVHQALSGMKVFYISLESNREKAFQIPENLEKLAEIQRFVSKQKVFDRSTSLANLISYANREFHDGDESEFDIPLTRNLVAQYFLFFHRQDLESYVSHDFRRANIVVQHNISDSNTLNQYVAELKEVTSQIAGSDMSTYIVGENLMINAATTSLLFAQFKSLAMLLLVIFLIMSVMFTSFKGGLIALVPNMIPIILMFGVMGLFDIALNPGTAMVAVIAIGIAIDGTIHLFSRYNDLSRQSNSALGAVQHTLREEARPMVATTLSLALGFGILLESNFTLIAQFGALSAATMLFALFSNLLITPIILSRVRLVGLHQILAMNVRKDVLENSSLFKDMSTYQIRKAILISEMQGFGEGELLMEQDTTGRSMYMLLSGRVEVIRRDDGDSRQLALLEAGQVFGEIGFIRETRRTADVRALSDVEVLRFDFERLKKDLKFFPNIVAKLNFNISRILGERLADTVEHLHDTVPAAEK